MRHPRTPNVQHSPARALAAARAPGEAGSRCRAMLRSAVFVLVQRSLHLAWEGPAEDGRVEAACVLHACGWVDCIHVEVLDGSHEVRYIAVPQPAGHAIADGFEGAAATWRDRRASRGLGLDGGYAELLGGCNDQGAARLQQARGLLIRDASGERDGRAGES